MKLPHTPEQMKELSDYSNRIVDKHAAHIINSTVLYPQNAALRAVVTDVVYVSYCETCDTIIGKAMMNIRTAMQISHPPH